MFKPKKLTFVVIAIIAFGFLAAGFIRQIYVIPVIMYHAVRDNADPKHKLVVSTSDFERQMRFLKKFKYNVIPLEKAGDLIRNKQRVPLRTVAITFDDGYKDNYANAFVFLKKYNLPATIFLITDEVSTGDKVSWEDVFVMQNSGLITFGSHTLNHVPLTTVKDKKELIRQIFDSKRLLEEKLGRPVNTFCYPLGAFDSDIRKMVIEAGYKIAVATSPKRYPNNDLFALKRIRISSASRNLLVFAIQTSGLYNFIKDKRDGH